jgi:hypothetical protein
LSPSPFDVTAAALPSPTFGFDFPRAMTVNWIHTDEELDVAMLDVGNAYRHLDEAERADLRTGSGAFG